MEWKNRLLGLAAIVLLCAPAHGLQKLVKTDRKAANGHCLPKRTQSTQNVLRRAKIKVSSKPAGRTVAKEVQGALADVVFTIEKIGKGRKHSHRGAHYFFRKDWGYSFHTPRTNRIEMRRGNQNMSQMVDRSHYGMDNRAVLAHELAHYVSIRNGQAIQTQYNWTVWTPCHVTRYAKKNRWEEFAEVYAAYVTNPDLLRGKGSSCDKARKFMARLLGENQMAKTCRQAKRR